MSTAITNLPLECRRMIVRAVARADPKSLFQLAATCTQFRSILHPHNQSSWRQLILSTFDFSDNGSGEQASINESRIYVEFDDDELERGAEVFGDSFDEAGGSLTDEDGEEARYLTEMYALWHKLGNRGVLYRPSQYGFLTAIQKGESQVDVWPETENAYSLFKDLLYVSTTLTTDFDRIEVGGEGGGPVVPFLVPEIEDFTPGKLLKAIGYNPYVWTRVPLPLLTETSYDILRHENLEPISAVQEVEGSYKDYVEGDFVILNPNELADGSVPMFLAAKSSQSLRWVGLCAEITL
ncbi:hypothetical protein BCR33DRAFT_717885, partial [Rhizoclosmatium globosum]